MMEAGRETAYLTYTRLGEGCVNSESEEYLLAPPFLGEPKMKMVDFKHCSS